MNKLFLLTYFVLLLVGCAGSNGDNVATQEELQIDLKTIMTPKLAPDVVVKPDTVLLDSLTTDSTFVSK